MGASSLACPNAVKVACRVVDPRPIRRAQKYWIRGV